MNRNSRAHSNMTTQIVKDAIYKFPTLPTQTIARYILHSHGELFDGDLEKIRTKVRYVLGTHGKGDRELIHPDTRIVRTGVPTLPPTWRNQHSPFLLTSGLWLVIGDFHFPFHELAPIEAAVKYAQAQKVNGILINGDAQDYYAISYWPTARKRDFDKEIESFIQFLDWLHHEFPGIKIVFKPGNHEYRLPRLYQSKMPEMIGLPVLAMDAVLGFEARGIEFLDYFQLVYAGKLPILHGHEVKFISKAVNPARGLFLRTKSWAMCHHCHSTSEHTSKNINGKLLTTWSVGCMCDLQPEYNPYGNDWNWGFAIVNVDADGSFDVENRRILPNGKVG